METLLIKNVTIGLQRFDIQINQTLGIFSHIQPSSEAKDGELSNASWNAEGLMYLPALKDRHVHLDKHFLGEPWKSLKSFIALPEQLSFEKSHLASLPTSAGERARRLLDLLLEHGTTGIRTHVDVDPKIGVSHLEEILKVRSDYSDRMDIEIVAFPQQGLLRSGSIPVMKEAMRAGADLIGGVDPASLDRQVEGSLQAMFELSIEFDAGIDLHLHDPGHLGLYTIDRLAELTLEAGKRGRNAVSHAYCLGQVSEAESLDIAERLKEADIEIITSVPLDSPMPRVEQLLEAGVRVGIGCDNIRDAWSPYGDGDLLARGSRLSEKLGWRTDEQLQRIYPLISEFLPSIAPKVGERADFILIDSLNPMHAIASSPRRQAVFAGGAWVGGQRKEKEH
ncbi:amidohydrolase family protein [Cohnella sp. WQ 127256]|uniref:amidohydrolase family protein n=1 Tax=Cohnella sp. WQ 127256 TaxID=2938790 RepID=UPI00211924EC|nr:amidohydrolase family protein [Cohnella sp. WQ 127256]